MDTCPRNDSIQGNEKEVRSQHSSTPLVLTSGRPLSLQRCTLSVVCFSLHGPPISKLVVKAWMDCGGCASAVIAMEYIVLKTCGDDCPSQAEAAPPNVISNFFK